MIHKRITFGSLFLVCVLAFASCKGSEDATASPKTDATPPKEIKILALGDSYTKGEGVKQSESFPYQLKDNLEHENAFKVNKLQVIAETGWTTQNLLTAINNNTPKDSFDIVTLLIGVNNQYQKLSIQEYEADFLKLLQKAIGFANNNKNNVLVISIPDYGATPFGAGSAALIGKDIDRFNSVNKSMTDLAGVKYVEITKLSREAANDPSLTSADDLHPSPKMYAMWVDKIAAAAKQQLNK